MKFDKAKVISVINAEDAITGGFYIYSNSFSKLKKQVEQWEENLEHSDTPFNKAARLVVVRDEDTLLKFMLDSFSTKNYEAIFLYPIKKEDWLIAICKNIARQIDLPIFVLTDGASAYSNKEYDVGIIKKTHDYFEKEFNLEKNNSKI